MICDEMKKIVFYVVKPKSHFDGEGEAHLMKPLASHSLKSQLGSMKRVTHSGWSDDEYIIAG
jgi:hypothetical protein